MVGDGISNLCPASCGSQYVQETPENLVVEGGILPIIRDDELEGEIPLGRGGYGMVVCRKWKHKGKWIDVAEKKLINFLFTENQKENVQREAAMLIAKKHKHIIKLYGVRFTEDSFCLIMEYMKRGSCHDFLSKDWSHTGISLMPLKYRIATQVAETMEFLHRPNPKRLLHLDLKMANVLLDDRLDVKLCDFGLSQMKLTISRITEKAPAGIFAEAR